MEDRDKIFGVLQNQIINPKVMWRDSRTFSEKFSDFMGDPNSFIVVMGAFLSLYILFPALGELYTIIGFYLIFFVYKKDFRLPFRIPKTANMPDPGQPNPGNGKPSPAEGISYFGNERQTKKELWFNNSDLRTHILIFGSTGAGKALKMDEMIHTPLGWKKNKELKIGDLVSTPFGLESEIVGIFPQGKLDLYELELIDGRKIEVSGDHLWEVHSDIFPLKKLSKNDNTKYKAKVLETEKLMHIKNKNNSDKFFILLTQPVEKIAKNLPISPYVMGQLLIKHDIEDLKTVLQKISNEEHIPSVYVNSSIEQRYLLIQGIFDEIGKYKEKNNEIKIYCKHKNHQLLEEIQHILFSLGVSSEILKEQNKKEYILNIFSTNPNKLFLNKYKKIKLKSNNNGLIEIKNVIKLNKSEDCQCIKIADDRGLFITKDYIVTHNTETLLSLGYNALVQGSGLIYVDGKGENVLFTKVFAMARTMGREDDVLVINYMTGAKDVFGPQEKKLSNTLNPFSNGSSGGLNELMTSLMDGGEGGGDMWKGRAISLMSAVMMALVYMRDEKEILLDVEAIREYLILENIIKLYKTRKDFPKHISMALRAYLVSLPGFQESAPKQNDTVYEQHGYLQMQFTKILGSLSDQYGFIFKTNLGEVDFKDVVLNRRILVVLLPALEKSTDELANLGKIVVACLKQMMASALGASIEGSYADVVETKPTNSEMPFMTILDEYGYYAVKGSAVMPAQARSLGFSMIFAGQDLPAFEKASKEEAASIIANCNIKICMKLEDPKDTYQLFESSAAKALVASTNTIERKDGGFAGTSFVPAGNANISEVSRINIIDLKEQQEGEGHILFKSAVIRARMFYAAPPKPPYIRMNYFVRVEPPNIQDIVEMDSALEQLIKGLNNSNKIKELEEALDLEDTNPAKFKIFLDKYSDLSDDQAAFAAFTEFAINTYSVYDDTIADFGKQLEASQNDNFNSDDDDDDDDIDIFTNVKEKDRKQKLLRNRLEDNIDDDEDMEDDEDLSIFLDEDETLEQLEKIEKMINDDEEEIKETSDKVMEDMRKISQYPSGGSPENKEPGEIADLMDELSQMLEDGENSKDD